MHYEGPRRQGRFIKKGAKVLEKVSLTDFSFKEIMKAKVVLHDNYKRTIIHADYHPEEELGESINPPDKFNQEIVSNEPKRPVILPLDFTKDWERDKMLRKDRVSRADDDEYDYELEAIQRSEREREAREAAKAVVHPAVPAAAPPSVHAGAPADHPAAAVPGMPEAPAVAPAPVANQPAPGKAVPGGGPMVTGREEQWEYMDAVGQAIKSLKNTAPEPPSQPAQRPAREGGEPLTDAEQFIPVMGGGGHAVHDPEQAAARAYRDRLEEQKHLEKEWAEQAEAAKAEGYRDGFRAGEEKAELQVRQTAGQMFGKVSELIQEFSKLKHNVLNNVQENFYELCQAMAEALIKREFNINPETFVTVLRRVISDAVEPGKFRIHLHPDLYERIVALGPSDLKDSLIKDPDTPPGDFKIESHLSVVDVNVGKLITELLGQANLDIFSQEEKAS